MEKYTKGLHTIYITYLVHVLFFLCMYVYSTCRNSKHIAYSIPNSGGEVGARVSDVGVSSCVAPGVQQLSRSKSIVYIEWKMARICLARPFISDCQTGNVYRICRRP